MRAIVAERGQVTIPKKLRDRLGIRKGTILEFSEEGNRLTVEKAAEDALDRHYGTLGRGRTTRDVMRALRGEP